MINVTKTYMPPLENYLEYLKAIWDSNIITNNGKILFTLKNKLADYLNVNNLELVSNGTLALQLVIKALGLKGEIITTPYTYVATATAITWEGCVPVFVDIRDDNFCINPELIENAITEKTTGILATHVYGFPCDLNEIQRIAIKYNLKVIYDAAHCFGVNINGKPLVQNGDASAISFHATKLFHTIEGGAVFSDSDEVLNRVSLLKSFGHIGEDNYIDIGINAKMSEFHAAMGLCVLERVDEIISNRRDVARHYDQALESSDLRLMHIPKKVEYNYSYYPVIFPGHSSMMSARDALLREAITPRRYFYPSLNTLPYLAGNKVYECPISENIASRVLCLPMYAGLTKDEIIKITKIVKGL